MLIRDRNNFERLRNVCERLVFNDKVYPDYVFKKGYRFLFAMENTVAKQFRLLQAISERCSDQSISLFYLNPDAEAFWLPRCGHFGCNEVAANANDEEWESDLLFSRGQGVTSMYSWSGQSAIFGSSQQWSIFLDYPFDLAILGSDVDMTGLKEENFQKYVHDIAWAIGYWKNIGSRMSEEFYAQLREKYRNAT